MSTGIRVKHYQTLWEGCNSLKAKADKLLQLLEEDGLKGKPSIEKCRKLKKKRERAQEVAELNLGNIISSEGNHHISNELIVFYLTILSFDNCRETTSRSFFAIRISQEGSRNE